MALTLKLSINIPFLLLVQDSAHKMEPGREEKVGDEAEANDEDDHAHEVSVELSQANFEEAENELRVCVCVCGGGGGRKWVGGVVWCGGREGGLHIRLTLQFPLSGWSRQKESIVPP